MKKKNRVQAVSSKLTKTRVMLRSGELAKHVPATHSFGDRRLAAMLDRYRMVYIKPDTGSLGVGVMRVERAGRGYRYQSGTRVYAFSTFRALLRALKRAIGSRRYLIQKGVHVLRRAGRPFDFRIMIQRAPNRRWVCTGSVGRVAHPRKIVSNGSQGGTIYPVMTLLRPVAGAKKASRLSKRMERLARLSAAQMGRAYPAMNELGLDIAVDRGLRPWILEINTRPDPCPFTKLNDPAAIRRIVRYAQAYGRSYCLKCSKARKAG